MKRVHLKSMSFDELWLLHQEIGKLLQERATQVFLRNSRPTNVKSPRGM